MTPPMPDFSLADALARAQRGDEDAFGLVWRALNPSLVRYLQVLCPAAAEDLAAETWLQVVRGLRKFRGDDTGFRSWLFTIARNKVTDWQRQQKRRPVEPLDDSDAAEMCADDDTERDVLLRLDTDAALRMIARLPAEQAEIVMLRVVVGLEVPEVARLVRKSDGAVRVTTHRALKRLQELLTAADESQQAPRVTPDAAAEQTFTRSAV